MELIFGIRLEKKNNHPPTELHKTGFRCMGHSRG